MDDIIITNHAIERFVERFSRLAKSVPKNPEESIRKMLKHAMPWGPDSGNRGRGGMDIEENSVRENAR